MKQPLLYLCHRIPYPPDKGDKIRSYHLLKYLCENYQVYLGAFIDDPRDWIHVPTVEALCAETFFLPLKASTAKLKSLTGLLNGQPLTLPYYKNRVMADWVSKIVSQEKIERVIVYSSAMAQYVSENLPSQSKKIIDFVDIDSDKWRQYSENKRWPMNWIYRREAEKLFDYEKAISADFHASLFVSETEADLFRTMTPADGEKVSHYNNGVDTEYFSPSSQFTNPYPSDRNILVFTGAMDYWPNIDAVTWFSNNILPVIVKSQPKTWFYIVGSNPSEGVKKLSSLPNVHVTGRVDDIRPYLQFSKVVVAPMRVARGIQNKVLEAMAMEKIVVVTPQGYEGINAIPGEEVLVARSESDFSSYVLQAYDGRHQEMGRAARKRVKADFSWEENLPVIGKWLEAGS
ncbi:MAG: TIGR03087 family PEP-CTERM/XrtA system glycosyltransferase [Sedimenticola sp.]|nr:TIGR03087 family PEP-CTERM/XrtA system glycosyltransferase [Sedimenticola sp.]